MQDILWCLPNKIMIIIPTQTFENTVEGYRETGNFQLGFHFLLHQYLIIILNIAENCELPVFVFACGDNKLFSNFLQLT